MNWALAGIIYAGVYVGLVFALGENAHARLLVGNAALLIPPIVPIAVLLARRNHWSGRQAVFWAAITAWPVLWLTGQIGWGIDEVVRGVPLPWFKWPIILQLCGSALPLIALPRLCAGVQAIPGRPGALHSRLRPTCSRTRTPAIDLSVATTHARVQRHGSR